MIPHIPLTGNFIVWWNCRSKPEHQSRAEQSTRIVFPAWAAGSGSREAWVLPPPTSLISNPFPPSCHATRSVGRTSAGNNRKWDESNWPAAAPTTTPAFHLRPPERTVIKMDPRQQRKVPPDKHYHFANNWFPNHILNSAFQHFCFSTFLDSAF